MNASKCCKTLIILISVVLVGVSANNSTNFLATNVLPDGEIETRISYRAISAKETTVSSR